MKSISQLSKITAALLLTALTGCVFTIPKGAHYSGLHVTLVSQATLSFQATFDNSAIYTTVNPVNQTAINKLYGFSDCLTVHHDNSARFGWTWNLVTLKIDLWAYTYANGGAFHDVYIGSINPNETHQYEIQTSGLTYLFLLDGVQVAVAERGCSDAVANGYRLYPYFGGVETAPHAITITVTENSPNV